jgi:tRNA (uracil-5-)-methyltransferase TRM9
MHPATVQILLELNRRFYRDFGRAFAATRRRVQPGMVRAAQRLPRSGRWLDLGCGSGELARHLARTGFAGSYLGLDASAELLAEASELPPAADFSAAYRQADLAGPDWMDGLELEGSDIISCFAVLHHLPGAELRAAVLQRARLLLAEGGRFVHSVWQFQHSPRLLARVLPWEHIGLTGADLEQGDTLLDWRYALPGQPEQVGLRYVHRFDPAELAHLAYLCGFTVEEDYESDGEGGRLGLYQIWRGD